MSWLDMVPTCPDVFIYQADIFCDDCADEIKELLDKDGVEDDGDSDTYPQGPYSNGGGESDSAHFCGSHRECVNATRIGNTKIGCPLGNPLTSEGSMALRDSIRRDLLSPKKYGRMVGRLLRRKWGDYVQEAEYVAPAVVPSKFPASLEKLVQRYGRVNKAVVEHYLVLDADHAYFVGRRGAEVDLLRATVNDEGEFDVLDDATVPVAVLEGRDPRDVVMEAISDGAWD